MKIEVECYAGHRGEETPRRFGVGEKSIEVTEVLDRWRSPEHRYFKVTSEDGSEYILRHDHVSDDWELVMFSSAQHGDHPV